MFSVDSKIASVVEDLVGIFPPKKAPSPPKLKCETLKISAVFVKF